MITISRLITDTLIFNVAIGDRHIINYAFSYKDILFSTIYLIQTHYYCSKFLIQVGLNIISCEREMLIPARIDWVAQR